MLQALLDELLLIINQ